MVATLPNPGVLVGGYARDKGLAAAAAGKKAKVLKRSRLQTSGGSYLASHDPREVLGLGKATKIESVEIKWPSGKVDKLTNLPINTYLKVVEGEGIVKGVAAAKAK